MILLKKFRLLISNNSVQVKSLGYLENHNRNKKSPDKTLGLTNILSKLSITTALSENLGTYFVRLIGLSIIDEICYVCVCVHMHTHSRRLS